MKTSLPGLIEIASHEGIVTAPYLDSVGVWTIGVGHTAAAGPPDPKTSGDITVAEAIDLFRRDIAKYERGVDKALGGVKVAQHEYDALVSFHYNTGAVGRATWVKSLKRGDKVAAANQIMNWRKPPEIVGRRKKEQNLLRLGVYSSGGKANVYPAVNGKVQWSKAKVVDVEKLIDHVQAPSPDTDDWGQGGPPPIDAITDENRHDEVPVSMPTKPAPSGFFNAVIGVVVLAVIGAIVAQAAFDVDVIETVRGLF